VGRLLRDYQIAAVGAVRGEWDRGVARTVVVHATGLGKTDVIAKLATDEAAVGGRVLLIAHRSEPLDQLTSRCLLHAPGVAVGRVQAQRNETDCRIIVASVQTLSRDNRLAQLPKPTMLIIDECHHAMATSYHKIMRWAGSFDARPTRTLGVTATLVRGDGRGFGGLFTSVADERGIGWAVDHGWLVRPHGRAVVLDRLRLDRVRVRHGDYADNDFGGMITQDAEHIAKSWQNEAGTRITVAFVPNIASAAALQEAFTAQGVAAETVLGSTPRDARAEIYQRLAAGETRVLVSVGVLTEAWDCPPVSCVLIARPTRLPGLYAQMVGRGLRPADGKSDCLVLDTVGVSRQQQLVTLVDMFPSAAYDRPGPISARTHRHTSGTATARPQRSHRAGNARYSDVEILPRPRGWSRLREWLFGRDEQHLPVSA
jgi:superfamily II DNA or RNA helicase